MNPTASCCKVALLLVAGKIPQLSDLQILKLSDNSLVYGSYSDAAGKEMW